MEKNVGRMRQDMNAFGSNSERVANSAVAAVAGGDILGEHPLGCPGVAVDQDTINSLRRLNEGLELAPIAHRDAGQMSRMLSEDRIEDCLRAARNHRFRRMCARADPVRVVQDLDKVARNVVSCNAGGTAVMREPRLSGGTGVGARTDDVRVGG